MNDLKKKSAVEKEICYLANYEDGAYYIRNYQDYKMPMLLNMAALIMDRDFWRRTNFGVFDGIDYVYAEHALKNILSEVLQERRRRLNADFQWTEENRSRFLSVSRQLYEAYEKGWQEAAETAATLEKRIKQKDSFLKDYEIEVSIVAYPQISGERDAAQAIAAYLGEETLLCAKSDISYYRKKSCLDEVEKPIALDKSHNWNIEYFDGVFDNDYICYIIHVMLDTGIWSFADIISIKNICIDVNAEHQHCCAIMD